MQRRRFLVTGLLAFLGLGVLGLFVAWEFFQPPINRASFDKIHKGMWREDLEKLMGVPPGDYSNPQAKDLAEHSFADVVPYADLKNIKKLETWYGKKAIIVVGLDSEGKVLYKHIRKVPPKRTFLDEIRAMIYGEIRDG